MPVGKAGWGLDMQGTDGAAGVCVGGLERQSSFKSPAQDRVIAGASSAFGERSAGPPGSRDVACKGGRIPAAGTGGRTGQPRSALDLELGALVMGSGSVLGL